MRSQWTILCFSVVGQQCMVFIYNRVTSCPLANLVDLCSISNISVFIFDNPLFGYYIHGQCIHGSSDVDLLTWYINFREEEVLYNVLFRSVEKRYAETAGVIYWGYAWKNNRIWRAAVKVKILLSRTVKSNVRCLYVGSIPAELVTL